MWSSFIEALRIMIEGLPQWSQVDPNEAKSQRYHRTVWANPIRIDYFGRCYLKMRSVETSASEKVNQITFVLSESWFQQWHYDRATTTMALRHFGNYGTTEYYDTTALSILPKFLHQDKHSALLVLKALSVPQHFRHYGRQVS